MAVQRVNSRAIQMRRIFKMGVLSDSFEIGGFDCWVLGQETIRFFRFVNRDRGWLQRRIGWGGMLDCADARLSVANGGLWADGDDVCGWCEGEGPRKADPGKVLEREIGALLADPAVSRAHWGIAVTAMDGTPIYSLNEGQFFQPASNTKLFTTAAAMALLGPETTFETKIVAKGVFGGARTLTGDLVLVGAGDANLSGREIPYVAPALRPKVGKGAPPLPEVNPLRYLEAMADQVAATGLKVVNGDVVGDDTLFPWEPYPQDWSIDDAVWGYGAPVSALTINDNQIKVTVTPARCAGQPATVVVDPAVPSYYTLDVSVTTGAKKSGSHVQMERALGSKVLRVYGSIAVDAQPDEEEVAIHDPAEYAAVALKGMLEARGIVVTGKARAKHRISNDAEGFMTRIEGCRNEEHGLVNEAARMPIAFLLAVAADAVQVSVEKIVWRPMFRRRCWRM